MTMKDTKGSVQDVKSGSTDTCACGFLTYLEDGKIDLEKQELISVDAANAVMSKLRAQLEPFRIIMDETIPWEEKSAAARLSDKILKAKRNKLWRKRKRKHIAEMRAKVVSLVHCTLLDLFSFHLGFCFLFLLLCCPGV